jgi:hemerythrin
MIMPNHHPFELTDDLITGIERIDLQHRALVAILNEASAKLAEGQSTQTIERITRDLLAYAIYHFETEEALIEASGYHVAAADEAAAHVREHRRFSAQVVAMRDDLRNGKAVSYETLLDFLGDWLVDHILNTDMRLAKFIAADRAGLMPSRARKGIA